MKIFLFLMLGACLPAMAQPELTESEVRDFFKTYRTLFAAFDMRVLDLFSDQSTIYMSGTDGSGQEKSMQLDGSGFKKVMSDAMPLAQQRGDRSTYSNIQVVLAGHRADITADRYSVIKCFTDTAFRLVVEKQSDGRILIQQMHNRSQSKSDCTLQQDLQNYYDLFHPNLPIVLDEFTLMEDLQIEGNNLHFRYKLKDVSKDEAETIWASLKKENQESICGSPFFARFLQRGAVFHLKYFGADNIELGSFSISQDHCVP